MSIADNWENGELYKELAELKVENAALRKDKERLERELNELKARHKTAILECTQYTPESWAAACEHAEPCSVWLDGQQMTQLMKEKAERNKSL
jgi:predicted nuclease with TOPRIM domain